MNLETHHKVRIHCTTYANRFAGMLTTLVLAGCLATPPTRIDAEDTNVFQRTVRAAFNVNGDSREASEVRSGHAIEIGNQSTRVSSNQSLSAGQPPVVHNSTTFSGPNQLNNDFDFSYSDISWRMREFGGSRFGMELFTGLGQASLGLTVTSPSPAQRASQNFNTTGLQLGFGLIWRTSLKASLHARASYYLAFDNGVNDITKYELYYAKAFYKNLSLHAGYADWKVNGTNGAGSDFHMHFAGPAIAIEGDFNLGN